MDETRQINHVALESASGREFVEVDGSIRAKRIGLLLVDEFSLIAYASAAEALRQANYVSDKKLFETMTLTIDGQPARGSGGVTVNADFRLAEAEKLDIVFVCSGVNVARHTAQSAITHLRRLVSHGVAVGAMCTGTYVLARAGLLDGYRATVHWENFNGMTEAFPDLDLIPDLYVADRNRYTCAGGTAAMDLMLHIIADHAGPAVASAAADQLIHHRIREGAEGQRMALRSRLGVSHPKLLAVIGEMEENIEQPVNCGDLAEKVGLSTRQLERLFRKYLNHAPTRYYLRLRLDRARYLLMQTSMPILDIALACGFVSASHFSKCYREYFHRTPSEERRHVA